MHFQSSICYSFVISFWMFYVCWVLFFRNWCAYVVTRTVSCVMEDGVETYIKPDYQRCTWGQCPRVAWVLLCHIPSLTGDSASLLWLPVLRSRDVLNLNFLFPIRGTLIPLSHFPELLIFCLHSHVGLWSQRCLLASRPGSSQGKARPNIQLDFPINPNTMTAWF